MAVKSKKQIAARPKTLRLTELPDRVALRPERLFYALPYFTKLEADTEYIISNPSPNSVKGVLLVFGRDCTIVEQVDIGLKPHCSTSIVIKPIVADHAGLSVLVISAPVIIHILYMSGKGALVVGGELAGKDNALHPNVRERSRTYGFGYRTIALGHDKMKATVYVSNPNPRVMSGTAVFYDQKCKIADKLNFRIKSGCTREFSCPGGTYGYGLIQVSNQACINVLHFSQAARWLTAAELVGESNLMDVPPEDPGPKSKILFDDSHQCRPGIVGDWKEYEAALNAAGYTVSHQTSPTVTIQILKQHDVFVIAMARQFYTDVEKKAIAQFVGEGGGLLIAQDFGNAPWSEPTRDILNYFNANDDNNSVKDPTNNDGNIFSVLFDYQRNFIAHPIVNGWKMFGVGTTASLSGNTPWTTIVETDDDSTPARRPVFIGRPYGSGRILAIGDSNTWADHMLNLYENKIFGIRSAEWLLFRI